MLWRPVEKLYKKAVAFRDAVPRQIPSFTPKIQQSPTTDAALPQPSFNAPTTTAPSTTPSTTFKPFGPQFMPSPSSYPTTTMDMSVPGNLPMGSMSLSPSMGVVPDFSNGLGDLDQFANDPSWVDWSQIMNDYADNGDSMTGIQSWPMMNSQQLDGSFM
jgi:hypothetical protein